MSVLLAACAAWMFAVGTFLLLQRKLSRIVLGVGLLGHGSNMLLLLAGRRGTAPVYGKGAQASTFSDPLPQAMALTAIVITFGVTMFLLALAYRSWTLEGDDDVEDDLEDRLIARSSVLDEEVADEEIAVTALEEEH